MGYGGPFPSTSDVTTVAVLPAGGSCRNRRWISNPLGSPLLTPHGNIPRRFSCSSCPVTARHPWIPKGSATWGIPIVPPAGFQRCWRGAELAQHPVRSADQRERRVASSPATACGVLAASRRWRQWLTSIKSSQQRARARIRERTVFFIIIARRSTESDARIPDTARPRREFHAWLNGSRDRRLVRVDPVPSKPATFVAGGCVWAAAER